MKLLINILSQDGIVSHNCGVGTMVKRYIKLIINYLEKNNHDYEINLFTPEYNEDSFGYDKKTHKDNSLLKNVRIYQIANGSNGSKFFGTKENWEILSKNTQEIFKKIKFQNYDQVITIINDAPFCGLFFKDNNTINHFKIWIPHSTAIIHLEEKLLLNDEKAKERLKWEQKVIQHINKHENNYVAVIGKFIESHLIKHFQLKENKIIKLLNGEILSEEKNISEDNIDSYFTKISQYENIILTFGRPESYKRLDVPMNLSELLGIKAVVITQEYYPNMEYVKYLKKLAQKTGSILFVNAPFMLPHYILSKYQGKIIALIPSEKEVAGLIVNELRKLNKDNILIVANDVDGINEFIDDEIDGILIDVDNLDDNIEKIKRNFNTTKMKKMNQKSILKLQEKYDLEKNVDNFLNILINKGNINE